MISGEVREIKGITGTYVVESEEGKVLLSVAFSF